MRLPFFNWFKLESILAERRETIKQRKQLRLTLPR